MGAFDIKPHRGASATSVGNATSVRADLCSSFQALPSLAHARNNLEFDLLIVFAIERETSRCSHFPCVKRVVEIIIAFTKPIVGC